MRQLVVQSLCIYLNLLIVLICLCSSSCSSLQNPSPSILSGSDEPLLPVISPTAAPQPFLPLLAPSPLAPFTNYSVPKLSGQCLLNFDAVQSMMSDASIDCVASFAPYLANVVCCPQVEATLTVLIGQSSKYSKELALNGTSAQHCLSDFQQILVSQGANNSLQQICSVHPSNLTEGSCPVKDVDEFESIVDSSNLISACEKFDLVNECCEQVCQNAISEAAKKLALKAYDLVDIDKRQAVTGQSTRIGDCRNIVLRWLANRHDPSEAKKVLRGISNCKINKVCPLFFPNVRSVTKHCHDGISDQKACCDAIAGYVSHLQKQSFTTNLQALDCAATLGMKFQKENITKNVYELCHISLKDFSLQVGPKESGCLLPSMPSDVVFDQYSGISFLCDLNDNIPAPWPSASQLPAQSCNKTVKIPALPAAASGQINAFIGVNIVNDTANQTFCIAKEGADSQKLLAELDWACGPGKVDCRPLLQGQPCYEPDNVAAHATYAFDRYYHLKGKAPGSCDFNGVAAVTTTDPSHGSCFFNGTIVLNNTTWATASKASNFPWRNAYGGTFFSAIIVIKVLAL